MSGSSSSKTTQSSETNPWSNSTGLLNSIIGNATSQVGNTSLTGTENSALNSIVNNSNTTQYSPAVQNYITSMLNGGGAKDQNSAINSNYQNYYNQTNPLASNTDYNPYNTPGFKDALNTTIADTTNSINGQYASAGRDFSGLNTQTLARGIMQGTAPTIASQYNQNVSNQQNAAGNLYNAGNTTSSLLSGNQSQYNANQGTGVNSISTGNDAINSGANSILSAENYRRTTPLSALSTLSGIGTSIGSLGGTSSGTSNTNNQMSGAQQFSTIASGLGSLFGGSSGNSTASNLFKFISDRRAKTDITQVGTLFDGTPVYRYRYIGQAAFQIGLMAQDVEKYAPEAVGQIGQYKAVDYKLATDKAVEAA